MSFEIGGDTVVLEFEEGTILAGATVRCRMDIPIRKFLALQRAFTAAGDDSEAVESAYKQFGDDVLKEWDIERDGVPIPADGAGMLDLPIAGAQAIFSAWAQTVSGSSGNSEAASTNGASTNGALPKAAPPRLRSRRS